MSLRDFILRQVVLLLVPVAAMGFFGKAAPALTPIATRLDTLDCMGTWYVQRQIPALNFLEAGGRNGVEEYTWDAEAGRFSVKYTLNREGADRDQVTTIRQRGWDTGENGRWEVAPLVAGFCPPLLRLPFVILDADPKSYMVCSGGLKSWMYVMTRERKPSQKVIDKCLATVEAAGFDMSTVSSMEHD